MEKIINPEKVSFLSNSKRIIKWQCSLCGRVHEEEERNYTRRDIKCVCQKNKKRIEEMNNILLEKKYLFLYQREDSYKTTKTGAIDVKKPIFVKCLNCGKESYEYYHNLRTEHKRCNCNENKTFTMNCSTEEFIEKWHFLNRQYFSLLEGEEYVNRNTKYKIKCKSCGKEDIRWGITLIDGPIKCKYCNLGSKYELIIGSILSNIGIDYIREYQVKIDDSFYRFDFFLPKYNIIIEYNGEQHYKPFEYFGGEEKLQKTIHSDEVKKEYCLQKGYLLKIFNYADSEESIRQQISEMFND